MRLPLVVHTGVLCVILYVITSKPILHIERKLVLTLTLHVIYVKGLMKDTACKKGKFTYTTQYVTSPVCEMLSERFT